MLDLGYKLMSDVDSARLKFEDALKRLEKAIRQISREKPQIFEKTLSKASKLDQNERLKTIELQRNELASKLEISEKEYDSLEKMAKKVSNRLDETISRLESILKSENGSS